MPKDANNSCEHSQAMDVIINADFSDKDLHRSQWKQVQVLASTLWTQWRHEYLLTLQSCCMLDHRNLQEGDVVLLKDSQVARNEWPMPLVTSSFPSQDGKVHKVEVKTTDQGGPKAFPKTCLRSHSSFA